MDDVGKSDVCGTDITIHDDVVLASGRRTTSEEVNAGSVSVDSLQKNTTGGEYINTNEVVAVTGNLVVGVPSAM